MISLNKINGAETITIEYVKTLLDLETDKPLIGVEMGIAYGGGTEKVGKIWKDKGKVYGFDTFKGHPKHLAPKGSLEANCMDNWYKKEVFGKDKLSYEYQRKELDKQGLDNVILVKGEVNEDSCKDIPYIHYALLDLDIKESMESAYRAVRDKILPGHVMFLHDVIPATHIPRVFHWFHDVVLGEDEDMWQVLGTWANHYMIGVMRK